MAWKSFGRSTTTLASLGTSQTWRCCQRWVGWGGVGGWLVGCPGGNWEFLSAVLHPFCLFILHPGMPPCYVIATLSAPLLLLRLGPLMLHTMLIPRPLLEGGTVEKLFSHQDLF